MRFTVGKKLGLGFATFLALMAVVSLLAYLKLGKAQEAQDKLFSMRSPTLVAAVSLQRDLYQVSSKCRQAILAGDDRERYGQAKKLFDQWIAQTDKELSTLQELSPRWTLQENRDRLTFIKGEVPKLVEEETASAELATKGGVQGIFRGAHLLDQTAIKTNTGIQQNLDAMVESQKKLLEDDAQKLNAQVQSVQWMMIVATLVALLVGVGISIALSRKIAAATTAALQLAEAIAAGDLTQDDVKLTGRDELADLTRALNKMNGNLRGMIASIGENAQHVASASEELSATSQQISANSEETSAQANVVSQATQQVNQNLQSVSTGAEEMTATIQSIATNAHEAATVASNAVQTAQAANATVGKLGDSSAEIGEVIKVITSIAQQTNLLALNATIEAARAGEAGKGFAVVANEVKELAKQTAKATEDISRKITAIQTDTKGAVEAIGSISGVINQVNDISGTIATAVEEQSATTNEMTRNVADAAKGAGEITHNIEGVAEAARGTSSSAQESQKAANELAEMAVQLRRLVDQFKIDNHAKASPAGVTERPHAMAAHAGK